MLSGHLICDTNDKITMHMCHHEHTVIHELITKRWLIFGSLHHYGDVIMGAIASQITSLTIVYSTVYSDPDQRKHQSSASLAFVWGIHRGPVKSPHKWPVTRKMFPFDDVIIATHIQAPVASICKGPVKLCFEIFFVVRMNNLLRKQLIWFAFP